MTQIPDVLPQLTPGRHRNPRKGACFMEFASYLAGEPWSDNPKCTHPRLAQLARLVNDLSPDAERAKLVPLIPSVIGVRGSDPLFDLVVVVEAATAAIPFVSETRQRALAAGLLTCERLLDGDGGPTERELLIRVRAALAQVPLATEWARSFRARLAPELARTNTSSLFSRILELSVLGLAEACIPDSARRMTDVLTRAIGMCRDLMAESSAAPPAERAPRIRRPSRHLTSVR